VVRYLNPGDYVFGHFPDGARILLGSCVSLILWHPDKRLLAANHILLPKHPGVAGQGNMPGERFASAVFDRLQRDMAGAGTGAWEYRKALFGGSRLLGTRGSSRGQSVGERNVAYIRGRAAALGWYFNRVDVGGRAARRILVDGLTGQVKVELVSTPEAEV